MEIKKEVIEALKSEVNNNPAAYAVFCLLALRKRNRSSLSLSALSQKLREEGFEYTPSQYRHVLSFMAKLGIGSAVVSRRGNCLGIRNMKINLSELGKAACQGKPSEKSRVVKSIEKATSIRLAAPIESVSISINGKPAVIRFPEGVSTKELSSLLAVFENKAS